MYIPQCYLRNLFLPVMARAGMSCGRTGHGRSRLVGTVPAMSALGHHEF